MPTAPFECSLGGRPRSGSRRIHMRSESRFKIRRGLLFAGLCLSLTNLSLADDAGRGVILSGRNPEMLVQPPETSGLAEQPRAPDSLAPSDARIAPQEYSDS